jgi:hypothetical protein
MHVVPCLNRVDLAVRMCSRKSKDTIWNYVRDELNFWTLFGKYSSYHVSSLLKFFCYSRATQGTQNLLQQPAPYRLPTRLITSNTSVLLLWPLSWQSVLHLEMFYTIHDHTLIRHWRYPHVWPLLLTFRECVTFPKCGPLCYPCCRRILDTTVLPFLSLVLFLVNLQQAALPTSETQISKSVI